MAGTCEKTKHRQGGPYLKTGAMRWSQREKKPKRAHSTIAPPVCVSHTLEMWVHGRQFSVAPTPPFKLKSCPEGDISLTPPWLCCYSCPAKSHAAAFRNTSPADCGGPWATTRLSMDAVRWAAKEAQSQDRGTWRAQ